MGLEQGSGNTALFFCRDAPAFSRSYGAAYHQQGGDRCGKVSRSYEMLLHPCSKVSRSSEMLLHLCSKVSRSSEMLLHPCNRLSVGKKTVLHHCRKVSGRFEMLSQGCGDPPGGKTELFHRVVNRPHPYPFAKREGQQRRPKRRLARRLRFNLRNTPLPWRGAGGEVKKPARILTSSPAKAVKTLL